LLAAAARLMASAACAGAASGACGDRTGASPLPLSGIAPPDRAVTADVYPIPRPWPDAGNLSADGNVSAAIGPCLRGT
jgi:hypothetical protein